MPDNLLSLDRLQDKIGKLPIWAWGIIGGTVVLGGYYLVNARKRARDLNAGVNGVTNDILSTVGLGMATPADTELAALPLGTSGTSPIDTTNALGDTNLETNLSWLSRGVKLASNNGYTALDATNGLQKYLQGKPVTKTESNILNLVLNNLGYPPEGAPLAAVQVVQDVTTNPAPVTKPVTPAPKPVTPAVTPKPTTTPTKTVTPAPGYPDESKKLGIQGLNPIPVPITG